MAGFSGNRSYDQYKKQAERQSRKKQKEFEKLQKELRKRIGRPRTLHEELFGTPPPDFDEDGKSSKK